MPMLKVTDVDMLKQILVKESDTFNDRPVSSCLLNTVALEYGFLATQFIPDLSRDVSAPQCLLATKGEEWKTARNTLSATF